MPRFSMVTPPDRLWLLLTGPLALTALYLLARSIIGLVRGLRRAVLVSLPLRARQSVELHVAGDVVLWLEGAPLSRLPAKLRFDLLERASGLVLQAHRVWFPMTATGARRARREHVRFRLPRPGAYELSVEGLDAIAEDASLGVSFSRPVTALAVAYILAILLTSMLVVIAFWATAFIAAGGALAK